MASVVFLRGVNLAGRNMVRSADVVAALADLDAASVGAAGTFAVRGRAALATVQARVRKALSFETDVVVRPASEIRALLADAPRAPARARAFVTILTAPPRQKPKLPIDRPDSGPWQLRVASLEKRRYAVSLRRAGAGQLYPNEIVEKAFGTRGTTRGWETIERLGKLLG